MSPHPSLSSPTQLILSGLLVHFRDLVRNRTTSIFLRASLLNASEKTVDEKYFQGIPRDFSAFEFLDFHFGIFPPFRIRFRFLDGPVSTYDE